jgi:hypothetical protein
LDDLQVYSFKVAAVNEKGEGVPGTVSSNTTKGHCSFRRCQSRASCKIVKPLLLLH